MRQEPCAGYGEWRFYVSARRNVAGLEADRRCAGEVDGRATLASY